MLGQNDESARDAQGHGRPEELPGNEGVSGRHSAEKGERSAEGPDGSRPGVPEEKSRNQQERPGLSREIYADGTEENRAEEPNHEGRRRHREDLRPGQYPPANPHDEPRTDGCDHEEHGGLHEKVKQVAFRSCKAVHRVEDSP